MNAQSDFPYPIPEYGAEPYWAGCNEHRLVMQQCSACGKYRWQPAPLCTFCADEKFTWETLSGRGKISTWTVVMHPVHPAAIERVPYVVVEVELTEQVGLRILSNLIDVDFDSIETDMPVSLDFMEQLGGQKLPVFRMATDQES